MFGWRSKLASGRRSHRGPAGRASRACVPASSRGRARTAREWAALTSSVAELSPSHQRECTTTFLPASATPATAAAQPPEPPGEADPDLVGEEADARAGSTLRRDALGGVRFPALSGAGPSGMRPEHLNEALLTRRRAVCSRLLRAVAALVKAGRAGQLPEATRWILQSRVVFLRKPGTATPRPIRVGEFWRRVIAKRLVHDSRLRLQRIVAQHRQCGVAMPGGADTLVHLRRCMEQAAGRGELPAAAVLDLDLRNAFPSLEWPAVRAAVRAHAPELEQWTAWCHGGPVDIQLPSGEWTACDRGAEQGDPLGPVYCALTLLGCAAAGRAAVEALGGWVWDAWYMDDGQVLLPPEYADAYLVAFDATLSAAGGTRVAGTDFKSRARLLGEPTACLAVPPGWSAGAVGATCKLDPPGPCGKVLGVHIGGADVDGQFATVAAATGEVCAALEQIGDAPAEMALLRMSANACRVVHLLRAAGPEISDVALASFDESQEQALGAVLGGPLPAISLQRASCGAADGGLGLRRARDLRFPAFVASRVEAKPLAVEL